MTRKLAPKPKSEKIKITLFVPLDLLEKVEARAARLSPPGLELNRTDAVCVVLSDSVAGK